MKQPQEIWLIQVEELISDRLNQENISDQKANKDGHTALKQRIQSHFVLDETNFNVTVDIAI